MTSPLTINGYLTHLKNHLTQVFKTDLKLVNTVTIHRGRFTKDELKTVSVNAPSAHIALTGMELIAPHATNVTDYNLSVSITIITKDAQNKPRETSAQEIIGELTTRLPLTEFDQTEVITNIKAQNLYTGDINKQGVMLWFVGFNQIVRLGSGDKLYNSDAILNTAHATTTGHGTKDNYTKASQKKPKA